MIRYDIHRGVEKIKTKTFLAISGASIAAVGLIMAIAMPLAAKAVAPTWDVTGQYNIAFTCTSGCSGTYTHDATISGENSSGDFSIAGGYPAGGPHSVGWSGNGNTTGNAVTTSTDYTLGAVGHMDMIGTIANNGSMSGSWSDNYDGTATPAGSRTGSWVTTSGTAHSDSSTTVVVTGNTAAGENQPGWLFNRDLSTSTPYEFNTAQHSIGNGSLYVKPIGANPSDKFVAENFVHMPISGLSSISYDFLIAGNGTAASANQFYMNVYAVTVNDNKFYDCRFDYVPTTGSTSSFTTASFTPSSVPVNVQTSGSTRITPCPTTLGGMPAGSYIRAFSLSVGDTSASDTGLAGYLDKVVVTKSTLSTTTYDLDPEMVTVTVAKNLNGAPATAVSANSTIFPMESTWTTTNIGSGTGNYGLGPVGFNNPNPYQATTSDMNLGASYTTHELTGTTVATTCTVGGAPYILKGYTTGDTLAAAEAGSPTNTVPNFTDIQQDKFVVVWNDKCPTLTTPPTTKADCRNEGWKTYNNPSFKNQGKCIDYVVKHGHKVRGDVNYTAYGLKRSAEFEMNTYDNNKGNFEYWDNNHGHYKVKVSVVKVSGHDAWFAGVVTKASNSSWVGQWLFAKVHDNNPDQISGSFATQAVATAGVNNMTNPTDGPFNVTKGNLKVN